MQTCKPIQLFRPNLIYIFLVNCFFGIFSTKNRLEQELKFENKDQNYYK